MGYIYESNPEAQSTTQSSRKGRLFALASTKSATGNAETKPGNAAVTDRVKAESMNSTKTGVGGVKTQSKAGVRLFLVPKVNQSLTD